MTITVTRSGGFLGAPRTSQISTELLPADVAQRIERRASALEPGSTSSPAPGSADLFQYDITIADAHGTRSMRFDGDPNPASDLIKDVFTYAK